MCNTVFLKIQLKEPLYLASLLLKSPSFLSLYAVLMPNVTRNKIEWGWLSRTSESLLCIHCFLPGANLQMARTFFSPHVGLTSERKNKPQIVKCGNNEKLIVLKMAPDKRKTQTCIPLNKDQNCPFCVSNGEILIVQGTKCLCVSSVSLELP